MFRYGSIFHHPHVVCKFAMFALPSEVLLETQFIKHLEPKLIALRVRLLQFKKCFQGWLKYKCMRKLQYKN